MRKSGFLVALIAAFLLGTTGSLQAADPVLVQFETSAGAFIVQLDPERAPLTVENFLKYVNEGFYSGTIFHRVVSGFVVQGGGYTRDLKLKAPRPGVPNESGNGLGNRRGTIAMARTGDPHSADSQFYINLADNVPLDPKPTRWGYAVFGEVIQGMEVIDDIGHRLTGVQAGMSDVPVEVVIIQKASFLKPPAAR
jgi:peptidyl-prolyl cis-trans isomerase A (cyclophilin A)/peptidyl-prolyl cis-trans isomerase B (cyclophilin B)